MVTEKQVEFSQRLKAVLNDIVGVDIDNELIRERELGEQSFLDHKELLQAAADYCGNIRDLEWADLTPNQIEPVGQSATDLRKALRALKGFNLGMDGLVDERASRIDAYQTAFFSLKENATPLVAFLMLGELNIQEVRFALTEEAEKARDEAAAVIDEIKEVGRLNAAEADQYRAQAMSHVQELKLQREEGERILEAQRAAAAETGVGHQAKAFAEAAQRHEADAKTWLWRTILSGLATVIAVLAVVLGWDVQGGISEANVLQIVLAKAVVLAVGLYFTFTAGRIYRANAHLTVVNRHREDSLRTYRAIAEGASDQETKSKVLLEAAHAIFGQVPTGLAPTKEGGNTIEVLDAATGGIYRKT